jgi:hypothetical protein
VLAANVEAPVGHHRSKGSRANALACLISALYIQQRWFQKLGFDSLQWYAFKHIKEWLLLSHTRTNHSNHNSVHLYAL